MGILITVNEAPQGTDYDQWKIYRATSKTGTYTLIATRNLTDNTYEDTDGGTTSWYKITYYDSGNDITSAYSEPQKGISNTYTTVAKVISFLNLPTITDSTSVTINEIQEMISRKEDILDYRTGHAWRERYSETQTGQDTVQDYEMHDLMFNYEYGKGRPVYLGHRAIRELDATKGDELGLWNGSEYEDWLGEKTEGRANDYWLDYRKGILYIKLWLNWARGSHVRIKYRYGETGLNKMVEDICTKLVAIDLVSTLDRTTMLPAGTDHVNLTSKMELWKKDTDEMISMISEMKLPTNIL
jgi:hypothetical protein